MIKITSLNKFFNKGRGNEIHVINDVTLELPQSGMVAIFGKSGCGKTTLLNVLGGLDGFNSGSITVKGENIEKNADYIRNKYIGYIFQNYNLQKEETCAENVANALYLCGVTDKDIVEKRVLEALKNVGMDKYAKRTPDTLSGGQQQRIAIARAIVKNPPIILADEPTGNLDEANTVMIMDLLKEISKEHLVLLVTHEANLVDYYCDTVVELSDGKVINVKTNENATGFAGKDKNTIYLGEYEKKETKGENVEVEYYGDDSAEPLKLRVINREGKIYLKIDSPEVHLVDDSGEIKLKEGVFKEQILSEEKKNSFQMSALPPISGEKMGKIFNFKKALKASLASVSRKGKKSKKGMRRCMSLFAAVLVFMSAVFGTSFDDVINIKESYNNNIFYVLVNRDADLKKLEAAVSDEKSGIDYIGVSFHNIYEEDVRFEFDAVPFETFNSDEFVSITEPETNGAILSCTIAEKLPVIVGKNKDLKDNEVIISKKSADKLIETSSFGYIKEYKDLLGLITDSFVFGGEKLRIAGVVDTNETALYVSEVNLAKIILKTQKNEVSVASDYKLDVKEGEIVLIMGERNMSEAPLKGETVKINGMEFRLTEVYKNVTYNEYLEKNGIKKESEKEYFADLMKEKYPTLSQGAEYDKAYRELCNEKYSEYKEYYFSECDAYLRYISVVKPDDKELKAYTSGKDKSAIYYHVDGTYYNIVMFKEENGRLPAFDEIKHYEPTKDYYGEDYYYDDYYYEDYYYEDKHDLSFDFYGEQYIVNEKDYVSLSKQLKGKEYILVHSTSPSKTEAYLNNNLDNKEIITPDDIFDHLSFYVSESIYQGIIVMIVILVLMVMCMYFIMRSSLMNKIKEIGIYRAIGASKKNLTYRFFVESLVICCTTILWGYLFSSGFIWICTWLSAGADIPFFYPVWYALAVLAVLVGISVLCGVVPIFSLLFSKPAQILAKYDI